MERKQSDTYTRTPIQSRRRTALSNFPPRSHSFNHPKVKTITIRIIDDVAPMQLCSNNAPVACVAQLYLYFISNKYVYVYIYIYIQTLVKKKIASSGNMLWVILWYSTPDSIKFPTRAHRQFTAKIRRGYDNTRTRSVNFRLLRNLPLFVNEKKRRRSGK